MHGYLYIVDDDSPVLDALTTLAGEYGLCSSAYSTARDLLHRECFESPGCILVDLMMPEMNGLDLQAELQRRSVKLPLIMISGEGDIDSAVTALRRGASDFLTKPFDATELFQRVSACIEQDAERIRREQAAEEDRRKLASLTPREREVFDRLIRGLAGKQIAREMRISYRTMEKFRANVMRKLGAHSTVELVYLAMRLEIAAD